MDFTGIYRVIQMTLQDLLEKTSTQKMQLEMVRFLV